MAIGCGDDPSTQRVAQRSAEALDQQNPIVCVANTGRDLNTVAQNGSEARIIDGHTWGLKPYIAGEQGSTIGAPFAEAQANIASVQGARIGIALITLTRLGAEAEGPCEHARAVRFKQRRLQLTAELNLEL